MADKQTEPRQDDPLPPVPQQDFFRQWLTNMGAHPFWPGWEKLIETAQNTGWGPPGVSPMWGGVVRKMAPAFYTILPASKWEAPFPTSPLGNELYELTEAIPGYPAGATVTGKTLTDLGYDLPQSKAGAAYQAVSDAVRRLIESRGKAGMWGKAPEKLPRQLTEQELAQLEAENTTRAMKEAQAVSGAYPLFPSRPPSPETLMVKAQEQQVRDVAEAAKAAGIHDWPDSVRQLTFVLEQALQESPAVRSKVFGQLYDLLGPESLSPYKVPVKPSAVVATPKSLMEEFETRQAARHALPEGTTLRPSGK